MVSNRIAPCVSQQLLRLSVSSFFQSALLKRLHPFSVIPLLSEYIHSYKGIISLGAATFPSPVARSPYHLFCCFLIYLLITEGEDSQSTEVGSTEGDEFLFSDAVMIYIQLLLPSYNLIYCSFSLSLSSTARRRRGRLAVAVLF